MEQPYREARPDPLFFLAAEQWGYRDDILAALKEYPREHKSLDLAALRLLKTHYPRGGTPGATCRSRVAKWIRLGYSHEMILAALVIASQATGLSNPFNYILSGKNDEKGILPKWRTTRKAAKVSPLRKVSETLRPNERPQVVAAPASPLPEEPPPTRPSERTHPTPRPVDFEAISRIFQESGGEGEIRRAEVETQEETPAEVVSYTEERCPKHPDSFLHVSGQCPKCFFEAVRASGPPEGYEDD